MRCPRFTLADARRVAAPGIGLRVLLDGMNHEREHADVIGCSARKAARIAVAHLRETPRYYRLLARCVER